MTTQLELNEKDLRQGNQLNFNNEDWCERTQSDDFRGGWIEFSDRLNKFGIFFNGACIHTSKTIKSAEKRLNELMIKWEEVQAEFEEWL